MTKRQFGGVFRTAFNKAGGPPWHAIIVLPDRPDVSFPVWAKAYVSMKLFGLLGTLKLLRISMLPWTLASCEKDRGVTSKWLPTVTFPTTKIYNQKSISNEEIYNVLKNLDPDVLVSVGAPVIFKKKVLELPRYGAINVHNGRIPKYRGQFCTFWEVLHREKWAYTCIHEMVPKVDAGRVLAFDRINVHHANSFLGIMIEKRRLGGQLLAEVLNEFGRLKQMPERTSALDTTKTTEDYFRFPTLKDIRAFSWKHRSRK
jgi:folate-dependent phosphoribosylglycinamide formyltransferase PurN